MSAMTETVAARDAVAYAVQVRTHLDDLPPDVVEELAGGLDADLGDLAAESDVPLRVRVGDPADYAAELRAAAGLEPRGTGRRRGGAAATWAVERRRLESQPWWPGVVRLARDLRPVWWVARGWVAFVLASVWWGSTAVPSTLGGWVVLMALVGLSVALGRGLWGRFTAVRVVTLIGNIVVAVALLPVLAWVSSPAQPTYSVEELSPTTGLTSGAGTVTNVFPYGPDGEPLQGVTLLDQDGNPIQVDPTQLSTHDDGSSVRVQVPGRTEDDEVRLNVFPQSEVELPSDDFYGTFGGDPSELWSRTAEDDVEPASPPRLRVPAVQLPDEPTRAASPVPTPTPTPTPTAGPAPTPSTVPTP